LRGARGDVDLRRSSSPAVNLIDAVEMLSWDDRDYISTTTDVEIDLTAQFTYRQLTAQEIEHYSNIEVTENLTEGGIHAHKSWEYYYGYLSKNVFQTSFYDEVVAAANQVQHARILSLGCGYGGHDLVIARRLRQPYELVAVDLNPGIYAHAARRAAGENLNIRFKAMDLNFAAIQPDTFDVVYALASLHHILNLEHLFGQIHRGLRRHGRLVMLDMIGKTQVLFWKENVEFVADLLRKMPRQYRPPVGKRLWKHLFFDPYTIIPRYAEPTAQVGMEGIRQEEIEPLMKRWFMPLKVFRYNAFMRMICTNWYLGARLNPDEEEDRRYLEHLIGLETEAIDAGRLKPTEMFGVFTKLNRAH
jgi:SAM-dependent methyltransferase